MSVAAAPAKINLWLHVGKKRRDGYHKLTSLIVFADVFDEMKAEHPDSLSLKVDGPNGDGLAVEENLVMQAARHFARKMHKKDRGAALHLKKNIPVAAGLGGGSADAAATMRALNELWDTNAPISRLQDLAHKIGADVPVCIDPRPTIVDGIGERLAPLESWPHLDAVLVNPGRPLSTAEVFRSYDAEGRHEPHRLQPPLGLADRDGALALIREGANELEHSAITLCPAIQEVLDALGETKECRLARMSGSGPTCFGLYDTEDAAKAAAEALTSAHPDWWVRPTRFGGCESGLD